MCKVSIDCVFNSVAHTSAKTASEALANQVLETLLTLLIVFTANTIVFTQIISPLSWIVPFVFMAFLSGTIVLRLKLNRD